MRYTLKNDGYESFKKICKGGKWVGRVAKCADGRFLGRIGRDEVYAATEVAAFEAVVSKALGFANADSLRAHNSQVRAGNRARRAVCDHAVREALSGNFEPFGKLLDRL